MPPVDSETVDSETSAEHFRHTLEKSRRFYAEAAQFAWDQSPQHCGPSLEDWRRRMDGLHCGLAIKVFCSVTDADRMWSADKDRLAAVLLDHIWQAQPQGDDLREAVLHIGRHAASLTWYSVVRPFERIPCLIEFVPGLETLVMRLANQIAKSDGRVTEAEATRIRDIQAELELHLRPVALDDDGESDDTTVARALEPPDLPHATAPVLAPEVIDAVPTAAEDVLQTALAELDALIGLARIKHEVRTLTNFLAVQKSRAAAGLPQQQISLHLVFGGNPGTGKTTVARIIARIFAAMGLLQKGHLVETDRSGLVAEYAGQTAPLSHKKIDEALNGVLFIDEAYSLVSDEGDDAYGREALQVLVKRLEDDRHRLVVILAGYSQPMDDLIAANAGLASRFSTRLIFDDYSPSELGRIFEQMCAKNHYQLPAATQARVFAAFTLLYRRRDEHFGNGRLARNLFERAIRRLADRIAGVAPLTKELLTVLQPEDILPDGIAAEELSLAAIEKLRCELPCPGCKEQLRFSAKYIGRRAKCNKCGAELDVRWPDAAHS